MISIKYDGLLLDRSQFESHFPLNRRLADNLSTKSFEIDENYDELQFCDEEVAR